MYTKMFTMIHTQLYNANDELVHLSISFHGKRNAKRNVEIE